jgi:hypothetical protein
MHRVDQHCCVEGVPNRVSKRTGRTDDLRSEGSNEGAEQAEPHPSLVIFELRQSQALSSVASISASTITTALLRIRRTGASTSTVALGSCVTIAPPELAGRNGGAM